MDIRQTKRFLDQLVTEEIDVAEFLGAKVSGTFEGYRLAEVVLKVRKQNDQLLINCNSASEAYISYVLKVGAFLHMGDRTHPSTDFVIVSWALQ